MPQNPLIELFFFTITAFLSTNYTHRRALVYKRRHCVANDFLSNQQCRNAVW